ncbi:MAG: efflux RND transporter periplasmic adaptor subunit [Vicinamibacterales bacterium]
MSRRIAFCLLLLAPIGSVACSHAGETPREHASAPVAVTIERATVGAVPTSFEAGGTLRARFTAPIASRLLAPVVDVRVRAGDRVRRGDALITLDARERTADHQRASAAAVAARESAVAAAADVAAAEAGLVLARASHQRIADLASRRSATAQELDQATAALRAADAQLRGAQARLAAAEAGQQAATAATAAADAAVGYAVIRAPFDGLIVDRSIDPGAMATPGMPLLSLEDPSMFRLEVRLDEARAAMVAPGDRVTVFLKQGSPSEDTSFPGTVSEIAGVNPASHTFLVKIDLADDAQKALRESATRSGAFGRARFTGPSRQVLTIPESAVVRRGQLAFVFAIDAEQRARLRAVSVGDTSEGRVEVLAGIADGAAVTVAPPPGLRDGSRVEGPGLTAGAR